MCEWVAILELRSVEEVAGVTFIVEASGRSRRDGRGWR
jgi:hypothetical protein